MSKNTFKGLELEKIISSDFHQTGIPLLISPQVLRRRGMGQIDLARFRKIHEVVLEICEIKSSALGEEAMKAQRRRLKASADFLSGVFGKTIKFIVKVG